MPLPARQFLGPISMAMFMALVLMAVGMGLTGGANADTLQNATITDDVTKEGLYSDMMSGDVDRGVVYEKQNELMADWGLAPERAQQPNPTVAKVVVDYVYPIVEVTNMASVFAYRHKWLPWAVIGPMVSFSGWGAMVYIMWKRVRRALREAQR